MSKKMLKRSLALGALMAFVITGQAWAEGISITTTPDTPYQSITLGANDLVENVESSGRYAGIYVKDATLKVNGDVNVISTKDNCNRLYGITIDQNNAFLDIDGNAVFTITGTGNVDVRAVRINRNISDNNTHMQFNNLTITAKSGGAANGIDNWNGKIIVDGNTNITAESSADGNTTAAAVNVGTNSEVSFGGETTYLKAINTGDGIAQTVGKGLNADGIQKVEFNSTLSTRIEVKANSSAIGIVNLDEAVFKSGDVYVNVENTGTSENVRDAIAIKSNIDVKDTVNSFNITVAGSGTDNGVVNNNGITNADGTAGIYALGHNVQVAAQNLNITVNASESTSIANRSDTHGIIAVGGGIVNVTSKNINVTVNDSVGEAYGVLAGWNEGDAKHVKGGNGNITLGGDESIVTVKVTAKDATGIMARGQNGDSTEGSSITVNGSLLDIDVDSTGGECAAGIFVSNGTESVEGNGGLTKVIVNSETTTIDAVGNEAEGIATMSEGSLFVNSNITVNSETNAIYTRGNAKTYINFDEDGNTIANRTTVLNGDIAFGYDENSSGTPIDADVKVNLDGEGSSWSGDTTMYNGSNQITGIVMQEDGSVVGDNNTNDFKVSKFTLNVSNGAKWTTGANSFVNTLNLDEGVVEMNGTSDQKVLVGTTTGEGTVVVSNSNAQMIINDSSDAVITAATKVEGIDNMSDEEITEALKATQNKVVNNNATYTEAATYAAHYGESALYDEVKIAMEDLQGENAASALDKTIASTNVDISDMAALGMMSWRAEMNDMNKRMGELRNANGEHGVWVRMVRGEDEYNNVKTQYNQYQLGYDEKLSVDKRWTVGMALSYTDGETSFAKGSGENTNKALSIYGSKLNNDGTFVDLIAKYARLENDFKAYDGIEDAYYSTNGYSVIEEFGKRIEQGKGLLIEPQVELSYGKVSAVDYLSKAGVKVAQDSMESLVGRVGFSLGKDIKQGNVYARASYLYDFDGETSVTLNGKETLEQDLGGGWWEVGVGANINLSKATYIYADVEKTFGG